MNFCDIIGNEDIKKYLLSSIKDDKSFQSYLFCGTDGIGKKIIAKEFAKKILCMNKENTNDDCNCKSCKCFEGLNHPDFFVINENGETIKIDQIRDITSKVIEQPIISNKKVYIINDCEKMTVEAQNCLLKTLEEPPEFAIIILITSNENVILNTIKSRCMTIKFKNIPDDELKKYAEEKLGYTQMTENILKSFNGSIGKAILQKENQEKYIIIENIIDNLRKKNIIDLMNEAKVIYDKENINMILEYIIICLYQKRNENNGYVSCIEKVNNCIERLKHNCNFDMTIDTMLLEMWECVGGIFDETYSRNKF